MKIQAIQTYSQNQNPAFKELDGAEVGRVVRQVAPKVTSSISSGMDMFTIKALTNKKVKSAYEKFAKFYTEKNQRNIPKAFSSCINSDGTLSKYALYTLNSVYNGQFPDFWTNIKSMFNREHFYGFTPYDTQYGHALGKLANIIEACKDNNKNQNKDNLKFAQQLFLKTDTERENIPTIINALKNQDGVCSKENIELFNILSQSYYTMTLPSLFENLLNKDNFLTDSAKNFVLKLNGGDTFNHSQKTFILDVLRNSKNAENRDEILDFISASDYLKENLTSTVYYKDKSGNINLDYLKKHLEINEKTKSDKGFFVPAYIYQSKDENIREHNIVQLQRLTNNMYDKDRIEIFNKSEFFKKDGVINKEFVDFILDRVDYMFKNPDRYNAYPYIDASINNAKDKDGNINWDIAEILQNFGYKFSQNKYSGAKDKIIKMLNQLGTLCKDENGNFSNEKIQETVKDIKYITNNYVSSESINEAEDYLLKKYLVHIIGDKNIYEPKEMLKILDSVDLNYKILLAKIPEYESLLFAIAEIPTDKDPQTYSKILQKLDDVRGLFFDVKDSHGISFLEKVLNSENKQLLKLITHPSKQKLVYNSELDYAYNSIQDKGFKRLVNSELKLSFPLLEEAVKLHSTKAWDKVKSQLNSPLCHRKEVLNRLWPLAIRTKDQEFCANFAKHYINELPEDAIIDLNRMTN